MGGSTAWAAPSDADVAREKAQKLAKAGRTQEAAEALRGAAAEAGDEGPALRFEAALLLQRSGQFQDAQALHREVSSESTAGFDLRVRARYAAESLYWVLELAALSGPAVERLGELRAQADEAMRRVDETVADGKALAKRLKDTTGQVATTRKTLLPLVGASDPMIAQLDGLLKACAEKEQAIGVMKKAVSDAKRAVSAARKALGKVGKAVEGLVASAEAQAAHAKRGGGKLKELKKLHDGVTTRGAKAAQASGGAMLRIARGLRRGDARLDEADRAAEEVEQVIGEAEIVLQGTQ
jgi:hypothetical protein